LRLGSQVRSLAKLRKATKVGTGGDSKSADHRLAASFSVR
jgi:hypothetical protein